MDWSIDRGVREGILTVSLRGAWDLEGAIQALRAMWEEQASTGIHRILWDLRGVEAGSASSVDMREIATHQLQDRPSLPAAKAAAVAPSDLGFGMARMMEAFVTETPVDFQVFRTLDEATAWLEDD